MQRREQGWLLKKNRLIQLCLFSIRRFRCLFESVSNSFFMKSSSPFFFSIATLINSILSLLYSSLSLSVKVCCELVVYEVIIAVFFPITTSFPHCLAFGSHQEYTKCHRSLRTPWSTLLEFSNSDVNGNSSAEKHSNVRLCHLLSKVHEVPLT